MADSDHPRRLRGLWHMTVLAFRADPLRAAGALALSAMSSAIYPMTAYLISRIISRVIAGDVGETTELAVTLGVITGAGLVAGLTSLDLRFRMEEATRLLIDREIVELSSGIPGLEHHERPEHLDRLTLLRQQRHHLAGSVAAIIENFGTLASIVTTTAVLVAVDPLLVVLPLFGIPSVAASARTRTWYQRVEEETAEQTRLANHLFELATTGAPAKELRVFGLRDELRQRFTDITASVHRVHDEVTIRATVLTVAGWAIFAVGYIAAIGYVAREAVHGQATAGDVILVISLSSQVQQQVESVFMMVGWLMDTLKTVGRYLRLIDDARAASIPISDPVPAPERITHGIDLVDVTFRYPGTDVDVLEHVDLHLPAGATVAVVGDNGAGKTTLIKLLSRFYDPTAGQLQVDGIDLRRIPAAAWRARMAAGFQDFAKLELLARETVGVGNLPDIDDTALVAAALDRASAADVAAGLPHGLESQVGRSFDDGLELSGGQWQKLALGRAMMREHPLLLILDEPTAALDADTEHALFERYAGAARAVAGDTGGITVLVSHRFSTVRMADLIVVVDAGGIAEIGSHDELMAVGGAYAELYELQARAYR